MEVSISIFPIMICIINYTYLCFFLSYMLVTRVFTHLSGTFTFLDTLRFGSLISATDPGK